MYSQGASARAVVVELKHQANLGPVPSLLVRNGRLNVGDYLALPQHQSYTRIRALMNELGHRVNSVGPSQPCRILGTWKNGVVEVGSECLAVEKKRGETGVQRVLLDFTDAFVPSPPSPTNTTTTTTTDSHPVGGDGDGTKSKRSSARYWTREDLVDAIQRRKAKLSQLKKNESMRHIYAKYVRDIRQMEARLLELEAAGTQNAMDEDAKNVLELQVSFLLCLFLRA